MLYMNISDFRKDLKNQFDIALREPVVIERGGVEFELRAKLGLVGKIEPVDVVESTQATDYLMDSRQVESIPQPIPMQRACCKLPKPCQHWIFDGVTDTWTNTLDGEVKEL